MGKGVYKRAKIINKANMDIYAYKVEKYVITPTWKLKFVPNTLAHYPIFSLTLSWPPSFLPFHLDITQGMHPFPFRCIQCQQKGCNLDVLPTRWRMGTYAVLQGSFPIYHGIINNILKNETIRKNFGYQSILTCIRSIIFTYYSFLIMSLYSTSLYQSITKS